MLVLSMDQSSNLSGVTLWENGVLRGWVLLKSLDPKHSYGRRLVAQVTQLTDWLSTQLQDHEKIDTVLFEQVKATLVITVVGAFCTSPYLQHCRLHPTQTFVAPTSWKSWAKRKGAFSQAFKDIKGVTALRETGFDVDTHGITSEDVADSCLIFKSWEERQ